MTGGVIGTSTMDGDNVPTNGAVACGIVIGADIGCCVVLLSTGSRVNTFIGIGSCTGDGITSVGTSC